VHSRTLRKGLAPIVRPTHRVRLDRVNRFGNGPALGMCQSPFARRQSSSIAPEAFREALPIPRSGVVSRDVCRPTAPRRGWRNCAGG
jgi:hypothetical protein